MSTYLLKKWCDYYELLISLNCSDNRIKKANVKICQFNERAA